jgi:hypothetical protein
MIAVHIQESFGDECRAQAELAAALDTCSPSLGPCLYGGRKGATRNEQG